MVDKFGQPMSVGDHVLFCETYEGTISKIDHIFDSNKTEFWIADVCVTCSRLNIGTTGMSENIEKLPDDKDECNQRLMLVRLER